MRPVVLIAIAAWFSTIAACSQQPSTPPPGTMPGGAAQAPGNSTGAQAGPQGDSAPKEPSQLVGKPAPDIEQDLLDGSHFSLKEQQGKTVVFLYFWATWCGPCVKEMPILAEVAEEYRGKDVALICVNQQEDADTVRRFLDEKGLKVTVSLDSNSRAGRAYSAKDLPMLIVIDKADIVRSVHVGSDPDIGDTLKKELDAILAARDTPAGAEAAPKADESETVPKTDEAEEK